MARSSRPFRFNPKIAQRHARLCRLIKEGIIDDFDASKDEQRQAIEAAIASKPITVIPPGQRARSKPFDAAGD